MAIWQFHIYFIPKQSLLKKYGYLPGQLEMNREGWKEYVENGDFDFEDALTVDWWLSLNIDINELLPLVQQFGELQQWTADMEGTRSFGNDETNDISVCFDNKNNKVLCLSCRLDLRQIDLEFINKALALAREYDCLLMDSQGCLYEPTITNLANKIQLSDANRFVEDPEKFFDDLSKGIVKPE
jgi:hypothetical protein